MAWLRWERVLAEWWGHLLRQFPQSLRCNFRYWTGARYLHTRCSAHYLECSSSLVVRGWITLHSLQWHRYKWDLQPTSAGYRKLVIGTQTRIISTGTISLIILICEIFYIIFKDTLKNNAKAGNKMSNVCHQVFENTSTFE